MFNKILNFTQNKSEYLYENSLFLQNIDKLIFLSTISVFIGSTFLTSDGIGFIALITIFLTVIKLIFCKGERVGLKSFELWLLAYLMIVIISLAGSSLFLLSLKGFMKTLTYIGFYFSMAHYLKNNISKIPYILTTIGICIGFEGIVGFIQNFAQVQEISTWQDVSNLNPEDVMTRVYGTLKPFNPNLLGGYFVAGIPALLGLTTLNLIDKKYKTTVTYGVIALISMAALFLTGCRGAYIGLMAIIIGTFIISAKFLWNNYKKVYFSIVGGAVALFTSAILLVSSLRARVFSIFAMRDDSSNSFRFNVYQSSFKMFKDNWLLGIGVGNMNFREIYGLYMRTGFDALSSYNIYLEVAVESGIFALIAFTGFLITALKEALQYIIKSADIKKAILVSVALLSIIGIMIHGVVDTVFFRPQIQFIFWTMAAIVSAIVKNEKA